MYAQAFRKSSVAEGLMPWQPQKASLQVRWVKSCFREGGGRSFGSPWTRFLLATRRALSRAADAMDAESLLLSLELASGSGQGLSPDRRAALLTSLMLVKRDYRFDRPLGRILGLVADYYIAQGVMRISSHRARPCTGGEGAQAGQGCRGY